MKIVFLIWITTASSGAIREREFKMDSWENCSKAVKEAQVKIPSGGDAEQTISIFCSDSKGRKSTK